MSRRESSISEDNLELLLDTMCNSFGGIMFIAILLAVLTQFSSKPAPPKPKPDPGTLKGSQVEALRKSVDSLKKKIATQQATVDMFEGGAPAEELERELERLKEQNSRLAQQRSELSKEVRKENERAAMLDVERIQARKKLDETMKKSLEKAKELKTLPQPEQRAMAVRRLVASQKATFAFAIKWNRLFAYINPTAAQPGPDNVGALKVQKIGAGNDELTEYDPMPNRGIVLGNRGWKSSTTVQDVLKNIPPDQYSLHFFVYPDSHASFREVREFFKVKGYSWNWRILPSQDIKMQIKYGGGKNRVQGG